MQKEKQNDLEITGKIESYYLFEIIYFSLIIYLSFHFNENPVVVGVFVFILLVLACFSSYDFISVNDTAFIIQHKRAFNINVSVRKFELKDIKKINATLNLDRETDFLSDYLTIITPMAFTSFNKLDFEMKDGKKKHVNSEIYKEHFITIFNFIKQHSDIEIDM